MTFRKNGTRSGVTGTTFPKGDWEIMGWFSLIIWPIIALDRLLRLVHKENSVKPTHTESGTGSRSQGRVR